MVEHGVSVGWRITPLGAPAMVDGKPTIAAWIEVSETALGNVRKDGSAVQALLRTRTPVDAVVANRAAASVGEMARRKEPARSAE